MGYTLGTMGLVDRVSGRDAGAVILPDASPSDHNLAERFPWTDTALTGVAVQSSSLFGRPFMGKKLYVGNLPYSMSDSELQQLFSAHGTVQSAQVIMDRDTGRSKGFGFVEMNSDAEAQAAIQALNGNEIQGRSLTVNEARPKTEGGGGGGGRGGYGGGGGGGRRGGGGGYGGGGGGGGGGYGGGGGRRY
jgi:RNA recognition motif. (a.k.a. RRM, RBD, or RNP domain)